MFKDAYYLIVAAILLVLIGWHQKICPYVDFFKKEGVLELTKAYCDMDERIAELLPEHLELRREKAMCKGDGWCDFLYYRK